MRTFLTRIVAGVRRNATAGVVVAALVVATAIAVPITISVSLQPTPVANAVTHSKSTPPIKPPSMGSYPASKYSAAGKKLPSGLVTALKRDVHLTTAQYLANSAAAVQGVKVVATLKSSGVHVLGSKMDGTKLIVNVASAADVAPVKALGASAVIGAPKVKDFSHMSFQPATASTTSTYGGQAYYFSNTPGGNSGAGSRCSIGFNGYSVSTGASEFVTAGHCEQAIPTSAPTSVYFLNYNMPVNAGGSGPESPTPLGAGIVGQFGSGHDYGIISTDTTNFSPQNSVATWGDSTTGAPLATAPLGVTGDSAGILNATLCKSGSTTGWTCGSIEQVDQTVTFDGTVNVNAIIASTCILPGDSGSAALMGSTAVGIDSGGNFDVPSGTEPTSCSQEEFSVFFPMVSAAGNNSVQGQQGANWQLGVSVSPATVTAPASGATVYPESEMTGTITAPDSSSSVWLYLDGSTTPVAKVSASSGSWAIPLATAATGTHSYSIVAHEGWSPSTAVTGTFTMAATCPTSSAGPSVLAAGVGDVNCDGKQDLVVRDSAGALWLYPSNGSGGWNARIQLNAASGDSWLGMTAIVSVGDLNGDGIPDLVARDNTGTLWLYPGTGGANPKFPVGNRVQLATGWQSMTAIQGASDFDGDGHNDLLARDSSGVLWLYPVTGTTTVTVGTPVQLATGWSGMTAIVGIGDFTGDGHADILARDSSGALWVYPGNAAHGLGTRISAGTGWNGYTLAAAGDFNRDGKQDLLARDSSGALYVYYGNGTGAFTGTRVALGSGFQTYSIAGDGSTLAAIKPPPAPGTQAGVGDMNGDGTQDVVARDSSGNVWLYPSNGAFGLLPRVQLASGWGSMKAIVSVNDFDGDGKADLVALDSSGNLNLYPGTGSGGLSAPITLATGWGSMTAIQGATDFTGSGHVGLLARDNSGTLWYYPGTGSGASIALGAPVQVATGWGSMTAIVGIGDFNEDGHADILARDSAGNLWLYPGTGTGTLGARVSAGTSWGPYTIASAGDYNRDGHQDLLTRDSTGAFYVYLGNGSGGWLGRQTLGSGFGPYTIAGDGATLVVPPPPPAPGMSGGIDFNGDGNPDLLVRDSTGALFNYPGNGAGVTARVALTTGWSTSGATKIAVVPLGNFDADTHGDIAVLDSTGTLTLYPGNGSNGFGATSVIGSTGAFAGMTALQGAGDLNGDGHNDIIARDTSGNLWLYPGDGNGGVGTRSLISTGWSSFTAILGIGDFNRDNHADIVARDSSGNLWLYPGNGSGGLGARVSLGTGWGPYTIAAIGDFNKDGNQDIMSRDSTGALWLYEGNGSNGWLGRTSLGSGFGPYLMAGDGSSFSIPTS